MVRYAKAISRETCLAAFLLSKIQEEVCSATETSYNEILHEASLDILSNKRTIKALIRLRGYEYRFAPLFFACTEVRFSRVEAHLNICYCASGHLILCLGLFESNKSTRAWHAFEIR